MGFQRVTKRAAALLLAAAFVLGACTRSASTAPAPTEGGDDSSSGLTSQQMTMEAVRSDLLTQTAQAAEAGEPEATETPEATEESAPTEVPAATQPEQPEATSEPAPTTVGGVPANYTLKDGEHTFCIARRFDVEPLQLLAANGLETTSLTGAGYTLIIPQNTGGFPPPRALRNHPDTYVVQPGDTIGAVACLYGDVYPVDIANANGLTEPYDLTAGSSLSIP